MRRHLRNALTIAVFGGSACLVNGDLYDTRLAATERGLWVRVQLGCIRDPGQPEGVYGCDPSALAARPAIGATVTFDGREYQTDFAGMVRIDTDHDGPGVVQASLSSSPRTSTSYAPTATQVDVRSAGTGVTLVLQPLSDVLLDAPVRAISDDDSRSLAFPPGALTQHGATASMAFAGPGTAPPTPDGLWIHEAVYIDRIVGDSLGGTQLEYRVYAGAASELQPIDLVLFQFDLQTATWSEVEGAVADPTASPHRTALLPLEGTLGTWFGLGTDLNELAPVDVTVLDVNRGSPSPDTEVRLLEQGLVSPIRYQTDANGKVSVRRTAHDAVLDAFGGTAETLRVSGPAPLPLSQSSAVVPAWLHTDDDGDGYFGGRFGTDCKPQDKNVSPSAPEILDDGDDDNCDGFADDVDTDLDGDPDKTDRCNVDPRASTLLEELCGDGIANDCDGSADVIDDGGERPPDSAAKTGGGCERCARQTLIEMDPVLYLDLDDQDVGWAVDRSGWGRDFHELGAFPTAYPGVAQWDRGTPWWDGTLNNLLYHDPADWWPEQDITVSVWIKPEFRKRAILSYFYDETDAAHPQDDRCAPPAADLWNEFVVQVSGVGVRIYVGDHPVALGSVIPERRWTHLVVTYDASEGAVSMYQDGELVQVPTEVPSETQPQCTCPNPAYTSGHSVRLTCEPVDGGTGATQAVTEDVAHCDPPEDPYAPLDPVPCPTTDLVEVFPTMRPGGSIHIGQDQDKKPDPNDPRDADHDGTQSWEGLLDELMIFDRVLTAGEIATLANVVTCDEGLTCSDTDEDQDGMFHDHVAGDPTCPAESCAEVVDEAGIMGLGTYNIDQDGNGPLPPVDGFCVGDELHYCGDGLVNDEPDLWRLESCDDPADPDCRDCAVHAPSYRDCAEVFAADPSAVDGPYILDFDGVGAGRPEVETLCHRDENGTAWTLVHRIDTAAGVLFTDNASPSIAKFCQGVVPNPPVSEGGLCTVDSGCTCTCNGTDTSCIGPRGSKFSVVGWLDAFEARAGGSIEYKLAWPWHGDDAYIVWQQDWLPLEARSPNAIVHIWPANFTGDHADFAGLAPAPPFADLGACVTSGPLGVADGTADGTSCERWYVLGLHTPASVTGYGVTAYPNIDEGGTTKTVELWVRVP